MAANLRVIDGGKTASKYRIVNGYRIDNRGNVWEILQSRYCDHEFTTYHFVNNLGSLEAAEQWAKEQDR